MKRQLSFSYTFLGLFLLLFLIPSCTEVPEFSNTPNIQFESIQVEESISGERVSIKIKFQDGDGDLGLRTEDTLGIYADTLTNGEPNKYRHNYFIDMLVEQADGSFEKFEFPSPTLTFNGRFPYLNIEETDGPLEGFLIYDFFITPFAGIPNNSLVKFRVNIADRALQESNLVETDTVRVRIFP